MISTYVRKIFKLDALIRIKLTQIIATIVILKLSTHTE